MARAERQAKRNEEIRAARIAGESVTSIAARFELSETRTREILRTAAEPVQGSEASRFRALAHLDELHEYRTSMRQLAEDIPIAQASAKAGAHKAWGDAIQRTITLEQQLGLLPTNLGQLKHEFEARTAAAQIVDALEDHGVPEETLTRIFSEMVSD